MAKTSLSRLAILVITALGVAPVSVAIAEGYGPQDNVTYLSATAFASTNDVERVIFTNDGEFYMSAPLAGPLVAQVEVPEGAVITDIYIYVTDFDATKDISAVLCLIGRGYLDGQPATGVCFPGTNSVGLVGSGQLHLVINATFRHRFDLDGDQDDDAVLWWLHLENLANSNVTAFAAEIHWHRQVVPAAAQARFDDVPLGHPLRQYVEALAAAGIASPCALGPERFCPDDPVTRGQAAALLAKALGLHWQ